MASLHRETINQPNRFDRLKNKNYTQRKSISKFSDKNYTKNIWVGILDRGQGVTFIAVDLVSILPGVSILKLTYLPI